MHIALKTFDSRDGARDVVRRPGDAVPEAASWHNPRQWVSAGWIREVPDEQVVDGRWVGPQAEVAVQLPSVEKPAALPEASPVAQPVAEEHQSADAGVPMVENAAQAQDDSAPAVEGIKPPKRGRKRKSKSMFGE